MNWKYFSIVLFLLLILTNGFWFYLMNVGTEMLIKEEKCSQLCSVGEEYVAFYYDVETENCYCIDAEDNYTIQPM